MKKSVLIILILLLAKVIYAQPLDRSKKPMPGPAPEITLGTTDSFTLANGMRIFVVENHKLPTIACSIELDIRPELEGDMAGYQDMMDDLLLGGTTRLSKDKLNEEIDDMGATINVGHDGIAGSGLKKYEHKILQLMADIAMDAVIKQDELDKAKEKLLSELETQKNDADAMVSNVSAVVNFGKKHPYGEIATEETIKKITVARCSQYYHTYFRPNVAYMAIVGDVTMKEVKPLVEKYFGKWQRADVPRANYEIPGAGAAQTQVDFIPRTAAVQSVANITYPLDLKPNDPDLIRARVANTVLGGGSQGRLFLDLREKHGWTYGAYSSITADEVGGTFSAEVKCRNEVTDSAIQAMLDDMRKMQDAMVGDTELQNAINYLSGNFAIGLENPETVAQYAINIVRYGLPANFYRDYLKNLQAINRGDIIEMTRKYFLPDHAHIVVAGSADEVATKLARFSASGKVNYYDYEGNAIQPDVMAASPSGITAEQVFSHYVAAIGGEKAISAIKDIKIAGTSVMQGTELSVVEIKKAPNMWEKYIEVDNNGMKMAVQKMAFNGKTGYQEARGQKVPVSGDDLDELAEQADIYELLHPDKYSIKRNLKGIEKVNDNDAYVVEAINAKGKKSTEYYDVKNGFLVKNVQGTGESVQITEYTDYKEVGGTGGYKVPYLVTETVGGMTLLETVKTVEVNKGIPDSEFN